MRGCIGVYELFNLEKLFNIRSPDRLGDSIRNFRVETKFNSDKIKPVYIGVVKKFVYFEYFKFFNLKFKTSFSALSQNPQHRLPANELQDIILKGKS